MQKFPCIYEIFKKVTEMSIMKNYMWISKIGCTKLIFEFHFFTEICFGCFFMYYRNTILPP